jgi:hypothetical protein
MRPTGIVLLGIWMKDTLLDGSAVDPRPSLGSAHLGRITGMEIPEAAVRDGMLRMVSDLMQINTSPPHSQLISMH